jgi:chorismate mutase
MAKVIIQPQDKRLYVANPKDFNPDRNKAIINETIRETTKFFSDLYSKLDKGLEERIDVMSSYARYRFNEGGKDFQSYAGKQLYKQLVGEKVLEKVKILKASEKLQGKFKGHILT